MVEKPEQTWNPIGSSIKPAAEDRVAPAGFTIRKPEVRTDKPDVRISTKETGNAIVERTDDQGIGVDLYRETIFALRRDPPKSFKHSNSKAIPEKGCSVSSRI